MVRDIREHRDGILSEWAEGPIHTRDHLMNEAIYDLEVERERLRTEGNRRQRRAASAKARRRG